MDFNNVKKSYKKYISNLDDDMKYNLDMSVSYYDKDGRKITLTYKGEKKNAISKKKTNSSSGSN